MSFILEAQKRDAANSDPAAAAQLAVEHHRRSRWRWILLGVGALVLINGLIIGYFVWPFDDDAQPGNGNRTLTAPAAGRDLVVKPRERTGPTRSQSPPVVRDAPAARRPATPRTPNTAASTNQSNPARGRVLTPEQAAAMNIDLPNQPATAAVPTPEFTADPAQAERAAQSAAAAETATQQLAPAAQTPAPEPTPEPAAASRPAAKQAITLADLSAEDRAAFPKLEFSTHIFADDPAMRAVVVNSQRLEEGQSIGEMVLRAVTEEGIIVDYRGQRIAVSVVETWN